MENKKPTLGYILKGYPRISETFISNEILLLEKQGFRIRLFPMRHPRESFYHDSIKQIKAPVNYLPTELLQEFGRLILPLFFISAKNPERVINALAHARQKFSKNRNIATLKHLLQGAYLAHNFLDKEPEIAQLHGHFAHSPTSVTLFSSLLSGVPFSFTAHAKDIYTSKPKHLQEKIDLAKFVVTCTKHNSSYLKDLAVDSKTPIHTVYHGIDTRMFSNQLENKVTKPPYKLLTVARLTEKKGLPVIYKALAQLKAKGFEFTHTLIGDGDDRDEILNLIQEINLQDQCKWLGTRTHDEVLTCFKDSDLFILGCKIAHNGDRDGIPNVLVESLAMGVPAISTTVSAIPEILINNKTGLTVDPDSSEQLATAIRKMLEDQNLRSNCISNGQQMVREGFDNRDWTIKLGNIFSQENPLFDLN